MSWECDACESMYLWKALYVATVVIAVFRYSLYLYDMFHILQSFD
jgi:hypothetical protein